MKRPNGSLHLSLKYSENTRPDDIADDTARFSRIGDERDDAHQPTRRQAQRDVELPRIRPYARILYGFDNRCFF